VELSADLVIPRVRCAPFHGSQVADPVGSAGAYDAFLFVDIPLPWERDIGMHEPFRSIAADGGGAAGSAAGVRWRPMGAVPHADARGDLVRVVAHERPLEAAGLAPYERREWSVPPDDLELLCRAVMGGDVGGVAAFDGRLVGPAAVPSAGAPVRGAVTDLHVCTHGRRDSCCGSLGAGLHQELVGLLSARGEDVGLDRCSHTGGHRFAPTALTFPDGYAWAHLTAELAERLIHRDGPPSDFAAHCRGNSLFDGAAVQAADRAALVEVGWAWADSVRRAEVVAFERDTLTTTVHIHGVLADGSAAGFRVRVELDRHIPAPTCGLVDGPEYKVEPVWRVAEVAAQ
jgi:hypothetical protein